MKERADAGASDAAWWNDRQPRFTVLVCAIYALLFILSETGVLPGDRLGLSAGAVGFYAVLVAFYGLVANVFYELLAKSEKFVKPRDLATYRHRVYALAVGFGVAFPVVTSLVRPLVAKLVR